MPRLFSSSVLIVLAAPLALIAGCVSDRGQSHDPLSVGLVDPGGHSGSLFNDPLFKEDLAESGIGLSESSTGTRPDPRRTITTEPSVVANAGQTVHEVDTESLSELNSVAPPGSFARTADGATTRQTITRRDLPRDQRRSQLAGELAAILRDEAEGAPSPASVLAALAALEMIEPGVFHSHVGDLENQSTASLLSSREIKTLATMQAFFANTREHLEATGNVMGLAEDIKSLSDEFAALHPLRIPKAALATRVAGFGIYEQLQTYSGTYKLLSGRPHTVLVYTEIENFTPRETADASGQSFATELELELQLYTASDQGDLLVWKTTPQLTEDLSANRRRDFYLVNKITLPRTLTVGSYTMKTIVTDRNNPDAVAEVIIPIDLVADRSALTGR
ncbi:MAG: hypothetical protein AAGB34_02160 [Planctomycetota bacterium]